jgi:hypothetical protein
MDEIELMRSMSKEPPDPGADSSKRMAERLMERMDAAAPPQKRRKSRSALTVLLAAAAIGIAGSAIAWAAFSNSAKDTVSVQCKIEGHDTVISATTGDPVKDCAAQWRRDTGSNPPPLVAYDNGLGGITVASADWAYPGATPLPSGLTQNVSMIEAQESLDDYVGGLNSGCFDNATAVAMTDQVLSRLGMADWTVRPAPATDFSSSAKTATPKGCVHASILNPTTRTVILRAGGPVSPNTPYEKLAAKLRSIHGCMSLDAMAQQVQSAARELGLTQAANEYELTKVPEEAGSCTTVHENVGGTIFLILRGSTG